MSANGPGKSFRKGLTLFEATDMSKIMQRLKSGLFRNDGLMA